MNFRIIIGLFLSFFLFSEISAQEAGISGVVTDSLTGDVMPGATIWVEEIGKGTICDGYGFFVLYLPVGEYSVHVHHLGYQARIMSVKVKGMRQLAVALSRQDISLDVAEIRGVQQNLEMKNTRPGQILLSAEGLKKIPALLGESDPLAAVRYIPGVQSIAEGDGYLYVRGGSADQNLILLDDGVIYNPAHLFGVFSVINPAVIRSVNLYKSAIPANYGNRLSSVVDIRTRAPGMYKTGGEVSTGILMTSLLLETPVVRDRVSVLVAGRRSQLDWLSGPFLRKTAFRGSGYYFADLNLRVNWNISDRSKIWATWYSGTDRGRMVDADFEVAAGIHWGNNLAGLNHWYRLSPKTVMVSSFHFSTYQMGFDFYQYPYKIEMSTGIQSEKLQTELTHYSSENSRWIGGVSVEGRQFSPYRASFETTGSSVDFGYSAGVYTSQLTAFASHQLEFRERWRAEVGVRMPAYFHHGPYIRYEPGVIGQQAVDSVVFSAGELVSSHFFAEPRLTLSYDLTSTITLKSAFSLNSQNIHMVPVSTAALPVDIWTPATSRTPLQHGSNWSLGIFSTFLNNVWEAHLEGYYRTMKNQVEFLEGLSTLDLIKYNLDMQMAVGTGKAYGAEFMIRKKEGRLSGWLGYTWSVTLRQFDEINNGLPFYPKHDRRHDFNLVMNWQARKHVMLTMNFLYASGQAISLPGSFYFFDGDIVNHYGERNNFRMPAYHRMDFSAKIDPVKKKRIESTWTFSIYNVYNRLNPFFIYFNSTWTGNDGEFGTQARKMSLLPIVPAISWTGRF